MFENPYDILSPEEAMDELRIGKSSIYELLNSGKLKGNFLQFIMFSEREYFDEYAEKKEKGSFYRIFLFSYDFNPFLIILLFFVCNYLLY